MKKNLLKTFGLLFLGATSYGQYCTGGGPTSTFDTNTEAVDLTGETTNISYTGCAGGGGGGITGVEDQTAQVADVIAGNTYDIDVTWGTCGGTYANVCEIWIDFDGSMSFEPGESVASYTYSGGTDAQSYSFTVPEFALNGTHRMRVMQWEGGTAPLDPCGSYSWGSVIDFSIDISGGSDCPGPSGLTLDYLTVDSAAFSWTAGGGETEWEVDYGLTGFTPGMGSPFTTTDNPDTISSLMDNTIYDVYVRAICGPGDTSAWYGPLTFNTPCLAIEGKTFCESFDSESTTQACWTVLNENGDADAWDMDYTFSPFMGDECANINTDFNGGANDDWLISPNLTLTGNEVLNFWYRVNSSFEPNDFELLLSTTGSLPADFTDTLMYLNSYDNTEYLDTTINLSAFTGDVYLAWHIPAGGLDGWRLFIDEVCVNVCDPAPSTDGTMDVCRLDGTVDMNTVITPGENFGTWTFDANPLLVSGSMMDISTLADGTYSLDYVVVGGCSTDSAVGTITVFGAPNAGNDGALTVCQNQPFDLLSALSGSVDLGGTWLDPSGTSLTSSSVIAGAEGTYTYQYIATNGVCADDTSEVVVTVGACNYLSLDEAGFDNLAVYPNPTEGLVYISNNGSDEVYSYQLMDVTGRIITSELNAINGSNVTEISLEGKESGLYLVKVFNENTEKTFRLILK